MTCIRLCSQKFFGNSSFTHQSYQPSYKLRLAAHGRNQLGAGLSRDWQEVAVLLTRRQHQGPFHVAQPTQAQSWAAWRQAAVRAGVKAVFSQARPLMTIPWRWMRWCEGLSSSTCHHLLMELTPRGLIGLFSVTARIGWVSGGGQSCCIQ